MFISRDLKHNLRAGGKKINETVLEAFASAGENGRRGSLKPAVAAPASCDSAAV